MCLMQEEHSGAQSSTKQDGNGNDYHVSLYNAITVKLGEP